eukprot:scaffold116721_cov19-Tisochrysis_lutea.AAC.1
MHAVTTQGIKRHSCAMIQILHETIAVPVRKLIALPVDFDQLKIENQQYMEKIEERNNELLRLKLSTSRTVQGCWMTADT